MTNKELQTNSLLAKKIKEHKEIDCQQLKDQFISLNEHSNELTSSLQYAQLIQKGTLPKNRHFNRLFTDYLLMYIPQSYVSGDFYWVGEAGEYTYFAVGDCTGHGVPGAMLTMLAQSFLNHIILGKGITDTADILKEFDKKFIETFSHDNDNAYSNDWIDIGLCRYHKQKKEVQFSGAKRKLLIISKGESEIFKGSNYPLGGWQIEKERNFHAQLIKVDAGDMIFMGSDGFQDQIGGEKQKKYGSKQLHKLLNEIAHTPCKDQLVVLQKIFSDWKKEAHQLDDICLMGIRV